MQNTLLHIVIFIFQKLQERRAIFQKLSYAEKDREKWKVFCFSFMSSEESDHSDEEVIEVRPLSRRSERVSSFLHSLDKKAHENKSPQAKRQMKQRRMGDSSSRVQLTQDSEGQLLPKWLFAICNNN